MNRKKPMSEHATRVDRSRGSLSVQTLKLASAYQKMNAEGREVLDKMVGQLADIHSSNTKLFFNPDIDWKRPKRQG